MAMMNIIGCGKVGKTLGRLWGDAGVFDVQCVLTRSQATAAQAVAFLGRGQPLAVYADLRSADVFMIAVSDDSVSESVSRLAATGIIRPGNVVFHCSGSLPSTLLGPLRERGALVASLHPVKSFADPTASVRTFPGTFCALEGDRQACEILKDALGRCGARTFRIDPEFKAVYHAATVFACNYLVALAEISLECGERAGLDRETAMEVLRPILAGTVQNLSALGPVNALTGPIARGEVQVVARQCEALDAWSRDIGELYRQLGRVALRLSEAQGTASRDSIEKIRALLG